MGGRAFAKELRHGLIDKVALSVKVEVGEHVHGAGLKEVSGDPQSSDIGGAVGGADMAVATVQRESHRGHAWDRAAQVGAYLVKDVLLL